MKPIRCIGWWLGLSIGSLATLLIALVTGIGYWALAHEHDRLARVYLQGRLEQVRHVLAGQPSSEAFRNQQQRIAEFLIGHDALSLAVFPAGSPDALLGAGPQAAQLPPLPGTNEGFVEWRGPQRQRLLSVVAPARTANGDPMTVAVTMDRRHDAGLESTFLFSVLSALPIALILGVAGAWWIARRALRPLVKVREAVQSVTTQDLSYRLSMQGVPTELCELVSAFNRMLERLQDGVARLQQFSGDLAHEMRTPISNLIGKTEVTLSRPRDADEYRVALEANAEDLERLNRLVEDMLFLAQAEQARAALKMEGIDLATEALRVAEYLECTAEEAGIRLVVEGSAPVRADRLMVQRAISNLLSNAIPRTPAGKVVRVMVEDGPSQASLTVANEGPVVPPEHLPHLFERFYRVDAARCREQGGTGLGLAIVKSIMTLHGGQAAAEARSGEMVFRLVFEKPKSGDARRVTGAPPASAREAPPDAVMPTRASTY